MKWIFTDKNILYDNSYSNILHFENEEKRDQYINDYLLSDYKNKLEAKPNITQQLLNVITNEIEIACSKEELANHNYIIIKDNLNNITYNFIIDYKNVGSNNSFIITIEKDLNMTYPNVWENIKNIFANQTHINNYYGYEMDGGYKEITNIQEYPYLKKDNEVYNQLKNKGWLVVFERVNKEENYIQKTFNEGIYREPYKIYIAPLNRIDAIRTKTEEKILYIQETPLFYPIRERDIQTEFKILLNEDFDYEHDVIFYNEILQYNTDELSYNSNFELNALWLDSTNEDNFILAPFIKEYNDLAFKVNQEIKTSNVYNNKITLSYTRGPAFSPNIDFNFIPLIVKKEAEMITIKLASIAQTKKYIPNSYVANLTAEYKIGDFFTGENQYTNFCVPYDIIENVDYDDFKYTFYKITELYSDSWYSASLISYLENPDNANIITNKVTNFIPIETTQESGLIDLSKTNNLEYDEKNDIYILKSLNYNFLEEINTLTLDVSGYSKFDFIEGINKFSFGIENNKEFTFNPNYINNETKKIIFKHYASFTPDWEERIKFINNKYFNLTNEENAFTNNKEFIKGNDILAQYKVNNPVKSKTDWLRPFFQVSSIASLFLGRGKFAKKSVNVVERNLWRKKSEELVGNKLIPTYGNVIERKSVVRKNTGSGIAGDILRIAPLISNVAEVPFSRLNMKNAPDQFQGNGDINGDLIFNYNQLRFNLYEYEFITPRREAIIRDLKMHGASDDIFLKSLWDYKQKSFNFYKLGSLDFSNSQTLRDFLTPEEYDKINEIINSGFTLWYDPETYLDWESNDSSI